ncbi:hypothetical protein H2200_009982 [Cladophialophora chaetospira]|uniref:O-methyltransferase domain-containing protein n=1 Tax=Cladophialophora chaetospira TaxID=386627 RepID=A0AA38X202_9EURO|nr:hypothetical protein H2200_009982 [Cladophialophora chaetospira]
MVDLKTSLLELAQQVLASSKIISDHLEKNSLPPLSLVADAYPFFPGTGPLDVDVFPRLDENIRNARTQLRDAAVALQQLAAGPAEAAWDFMTGHFTSATLQYVYHFHIAEHVPVDKDISYKELADTAGVDQSQCTRILKFMATQNFFQQTRPGYIGHTAMSKLLLVPDFRDTVGYVTEESFSGAPRLSENAEKYPGSQEKNQAPWHLANNTDLPIFEYFEDQPARMGRFMGCMRALASAESYSIKNMIEAFDWQSLGNGVVVDVGGSFGHCSSQIAESAPGLKFIVQDLQKVVNQAEKERANDKNIDRIKFQAHNFFTPQPVKEADVYLLRFICHDYSDKYASQILGHLAAAMGPESRIIIVDSVLPEVGVLSKFEEQRARILDMEMMMTYNSLERDEDGWQSLLKQADPRLELRSVKKIPGNILAVLEVGLRHSN